MTDQDPESDAYGEQPYIDIIDLDLYNKRLVDFFSIFEDLGCFEPHHNVGIQELFSLPEMEEEGELIFYYKDYGSFWMQYNLDRYSKDWLVAGHLEVNPPLLKLVSESDGCDMEELLDSVDGSDYGVQTDTYLSGRDKINTEMGTVMEIGVPVQYDEEKMLQTIRAGTSILDGFREQLIENF
ncbi:hypothetical protein [Halococcus sediminicola]|uniref:hypothetical protein n=1 Tax=Halococcus sediminicola TaxID=1264579 RepID=UPI000679C53E|nr:hypothetical protein [Halococcus sediminicola]